MSDKAEEKRAMRGGEYRRIESSEDMDKEEIKTPFS